MTMVVSAIMRGMEDMMGVTLEELATMLLRVFGCTAYAHVDNGKLEPRAIKCMFLGYGYGVKGYKLWNPKTKKIFMSRSVVFKESVMFNDSLSIDVSPVGSDEEQQHVSVQVEHVDDQETEIVDNNVHDIVQHSPPVLQPQNQSIVDRRTKRNCGPHPCLIEECDMVHYAFSCAEQVENIHEPATYTEVVVSGDREKWISAMQEEMQSLEKNGTWDVVRLPKQKKAVRCKWIFKRKEGLSPSEPPRLKASLSIDVSPVGSDEEQQHVSVQVEHVDDQETEIVDNNVHDIVQHSPPVLQPQNQSIVDRRTKRNCGPHPCLIEECDMVHYAFSCAEQVENIHEPATYTEVVVSGDREKWISAMQEEMQSLEKNGTWDVVRLPKQKKAVRCKWIFKRKEGLSPSEPPRLKASQQSYIKKVLHRFYMHDAKSVSTPIAPHFKLSALQCASTDDDFEYMSRVPYSSAVGSLMYAMVCSHPDLSYAMSLVSRYMANLGKEHWKAVQWIFRYLRGTTNACLKFGKTDKGLTSYVDSDFAVDLDKRRSLTGYVFTIGGCVLRVFGCTAYAHVDNGKLEPRAIKCMFLGYGYGVKGYKLWNPKTKKIFMSRSVVFKESVMFNDSLSIDVSPVGSDEEQQHVSVQVEHVDDQETEIVDNNVHDIVQHSPPVLQPQNQSIVDRRTKRNCGPHPCLIEECDMVHYAFSCAEQVENIHEPATYTEVVVSGDREKWISAMQEEMQSLEKNGTWDVVRLPKQKKAVRCKWIFKRKEGLSPTLQCASTDDDFEYMSRVPYSSAVGSLMYAMVCSHPDLSYAMSLVSRYMANLGKEHWKAVQWIFRYLRGTTNACLKFGKTDKGLTSYVDSDFAVDLDKRRSLTGYVFTIGGCVAGAELRGGIEAGQQRQAGEAAYPARNGVGERTGCEDVDDEGR
ncbi:unnamed protein product [Miscanthus lutarioriparius]|uniref:Retroviral polymerase SH3-like domain-containing protein n=1 Tax=Miscanthus lutarioriparius TaxID=422564 RepID=A0A811PVT5_9POAL|nr:unnamed protein product [Miscanthus lutarioriparius]